MLVYHVYTATTRSGEIVTCLVSEDALESASGIEVFLPRGAEGAEEHGTVEISGPAEYVLTECLTDK